MQCSVVTAWKSALRGRRMMSALWDPLYGSVSGKSTNHYFSPQLSTWKWLHHMNGAAGQQPTTSSLNSGEERLCASPQATETTLCFISIQNCQINNGDSQRLLCKTELLNDNKMNVTNAFPLTYYCYYLYFFRASAFQFKRNMIIFGKHCTSAKLQIYCLKKVRGVVFSGYQAL